MPLSPLPLVPLIKLYMTSQPIEQLKFYVLGSLGDGLVEISAEGRVWQEEIIERLPGLSVYICSKIGRWMILYQFWGCLLLLVTCIGSLGGYKDGNLDIIT